MEGAIHSKLKVAACWEGPEETIWTDAAALPLGQAAVARALPAAAPTNCAAPLGTRTVVSELLQLQSEAAWPLPEAIENCTVCPTPTVAELGDSEMGWLGVLAPVETFVLLTPHPAAERTLASRTRDSHLLATLLFSMPQLSA